MSNVAPEKIVKGFDVGRLRAEFPILGELSRGKPLAYLDNAATTQKPRAVLEAMEHYYLECNANIHRGVYQLSERATRAYEAARDRVRCFLGAGDSREIVFVRGTTEAINLVANSFGTHTLGRGDEVLVTEMEHHSNIVPWQMLCARTGATLRVAPITERGELDLERFEALLSERTRLVAAVHASNTLGTINPVRRIVELAHARGARVLLDGAQAVAHLPVDVRELGCDFYAFSGHKLFGPTGIGALYGRRELLEAMPPYQGGGNMIMRVTFEETTYAASPQRFEAGTPNIAGAIGLGAALDWLAAQELPRARAWEELLLAEATRGLEQIEGLRIVGRADAKVPVLSFVLDGVHPHDLGTFLDQEGVAVRTGQHCTEPLMARYRVPATTRASFSFYNTPDEVERLCEQVRRAKEFFV